MDHDKQYKVARDDGQETQSTGNTLYEACMAAKAHGPKAVWWPSTAAAATVPEELHDTRPRAIDLNLLRTAFVLASCPKS
jgi:hypothetical protein